MGRSNIIYNMERDLAYCLGEREEKLERIDRIEKLAETLPVLRDRLAKLELLIGSAEMLLQERIPGWTRERVRPTRRWQHQSPIEFGTCVRKSLEILRAATRPLTTRELADEVLAQEAILDLDKLTWERVRTNIDAGLRKQKEAGLIASAGHKPSYWWVVGNPHIEVAGKC